MNELKESSVTHAHIGPVKHPELGVTVNGQSSLRYLRYLRYLRFLRPAGERRETCRPGATVRWRVPGGNRFGTARAASMSIFHRRGVRAT